MKCINVMQCKSQKTKKQKPKNNVHKENSNEAQGPCQKESIRLSLLRPKPFRCTTSIGVLIHIRVISNSRIRIKVESLYQFINKCYRILCLQHMHFWFVFSQQLAACNSLDECVQTSHKNDKPKQAYHASCPQKGQTPQV